MTEVRWASVSDGTSVALSTKTYFFGDVIVLRCVGRLVAGQDTAAFRQGVEKLLSERREVVMNLTEVDHRLGRTRTSQTHKRELENGARLVSSGTYLPELLRRTRLDTVITVYANEDEAIASFPKQQ